MSEKEANVSIEYDAFWFFVEKLQLAKINESALARASAMACRLNARALQAAVGLEIEVDADASPGLLNRYTRREQ